MGRIAPILVIFWLKFFYKFLCVNIQEEEVYNKAKDIFQQFNTDCNYEYVDASLVDSEKLLEIYFNKKPPFGNGKKKSEFPDAISLLSLESYLDPDEKIYIISDDNDLKEYCKEKNNFINVENLEKLLDIYNQHTNIRTDQIKEFIEKNSIEIKQMVDKFLYDCEFYNYSTWEDSEVDDFSIEEISDFTANVIQVNDKECQITFDINVDINVTVIGPDFVNGIYDREEGRVFTFDSTKIEQTINKEFTCELGLTYEFSNGHLQNVDWENFYITNTSSGIEISIEENQELELY